MYPSSLMWFGKYSFEALQTMYLPLSSGFGTYLIMLAVQISSCESGPVFWTSWWSMVIFSGPRSSSRSPMNHRKLGDGLDPWHRHSKVDSFDATRGTFRSVMIFTDFGGTEMKKLRHNYKMEEKSQRIVLKIGTPLRSDQPNCTKP